MHSPSSFPAIIVLVFLLAYHLEESVALLSSKFPSFSLLHVSRTKYIVQHEVPTTSTITAPVTKQLSDNFPLNTAYAKIDHIRFADDGDEMYAIRENVRLDQNPQPSSGGSLLHSETRKIPNVINWIKNTRIIHSKGGGRDYSNNRPTSHNVLSNALSTVWSKLSSRYTNTESQFQWNSGLKSNDNKIITATKRNFALGAVVKDQSESESESMPYQTSWDLVLASPCKINFFLRILKRRRTGYHDLASLFQTISLPDAMKFKKLNPTTATQDDLRCSDSSLKTDSSNLVIKALDLMRRKTGINQYFCIVLDKLVPIQAGLGGGSGNAATAMHAFNALCGYPATLEQLKEWSGEIGSDITFFFSTGTAYCTGRGEIVKPMKPLPGADDVEVVVFKPKEGLSTPLVFKTLNLNNLHPIRPWQVLKVFREKGPLHAAKNDMLINDLEPPAFTCLPSLSELKAKVSQLDGVDGAMMSGSGTSVFTVGLKGSFFAEKIVKKMQEEYPLLKIYTCRLVNKKDDIKYWYDIPLYSNEGGPFTQSYEEWCNPRFD